MNSKNAIKTILLLSPPSNDEENEKRGFAPMEAIASTFLIESLQVFTRKKGTSKVNYRIQREKVFKEK